MLKLSDFDYTLPKELIAQYPLKERDTARILILNRKQATIEHTVFKNIVHYLTKNDLLILNDTRVLPARLVGSRLTGGKVEALLLRQKKGLKFAVLIRPARLKLKEKIIFDSGRIYGEVTEKNEITFSGANLEGIYRLGLMPLPPYIKRIPEELDNVYYQTVYAQKRGSVASPTAGLHFTKELLQQILACEVKIGYITLHINYSTFKPVKVEDITKHTMEPEYFCVSTDTQRLIAQTRAKKCRIIAVGTTSLRALEMYAHGFKQGYTDLFIYPGYQFKLANCLLTNFHLPRTTLFMLVCAFAGGKLIKKAYQEAIAEKYRFYSYGDAMLII